MVINGKHVQLGTKRRLTYTAWYERVGRRLIITASVRRGDHMVAMTDLECEFRETACSEEQAVVAALVQYMDDAIFDIPTNPAPSSGVAARLQPAPSARSEWADARASEWAAG